MKRLLLVFVLFSLIFVFLVQSKVLAEVPGVTTTSTPVPTVEPTPIITATPSIEPSVIPTTTVSPSIEPSVIPTLTLTPTPSFSPEPVKNSPKGDLNQDGTVNIQDYTVLNSNFGSNLAIADLNSDGVVNIQDYILLSNNFGKTG